MIVPSIDLAGGNAVQLIGGKEQALDAGDPRPLAARFGRVGEIAVIDLDAALRRGSNAAVIRELVQAAPCRVGGGIRDARAARAWLDAGARQVILGTAAVPEVLRELPRERVIAALDAVDGEVVVDGWRTRTGASIASRMAELAPYVAGFLVTFVEREGRLSGTALDRVPALVEAARGRKVTIAGGVTREEEIAALDALGCDAQVGMALYTGRISLTDAFAAPLTSDRPDGLWPTVVVDERGVALGLAYSDRESLAVAIERGVGAYHSRKRGLWVKGETSGATQELLRVEVDCDRDALRFVVRQAGDGFCHRGTATCFGPPTGLDKLERTLAARREDAPAGSYTRRLLDDAALLREKLVEEANELASATTPDEVAWEAADVLYFALVACAKAGVRLADVEAELERRSLAVSRRSAKPDEAPVSDGPLLRVVAAADVPSLRRQAVDAATLAGAGRIVDDVRRGGEAALRRYAEQFGDRAAGEPLVIGRAELEAARDALPAEARAALEGMAARIRAFADAHRAALPDFAIDVPGGRAGTRMAPVARAGCYAPGGRYPLPSSVLMTALTARAAGVGEVWVASPRPSVETLAAAAIAGADALLAVGGAQAIAALAYGAGAVPPCDAIVGPGNRWVTAAKQLVAGEVAIDMLAGPSELVVLADAAADPALIAADLLAQAEHDPDAIPIVVTLDGAGVAAIEAALTEQLATLPTAAIARAALRNGFVVVASGLDEAVALCDRLAPEHLALHLVDPERAATRLAHYGALFVGEGAAEVLGDYGAGPNHVLPTGGTARSVGALSVLTFLRPQTWLRIDDRVAARPVVADAVTVARLEGLEAHARSAQRRSTQGEPGDA